MEAESDMPLFSKTLPDTLNRLMCALDFTFCLDLTSEQKTSFADTFVSVIQRVNKNLRQLIEAYRSNLPTFSEKLLFSEIHAFLKKIRKVCAVVQHSEICCALDELRILLTELNSVLNPYDDTVYSDFAHRELDIFVETEWPEHLMEIDNFSLRLSAESRTGHAAEKIVEISTKLKALCPIFCVISEDCIHMENLGRFLWFCDSENRMEIRGEVLHCVKSFEYYCQLQGVNVLKDRKKEDAVPEKTMDMFIRTTHDVSSCLSGRLSGNWVEDFWRNAVKGELKDLFADRMKKTSGCVGFLIAVLKRIVEHEKMDSIERLKDVLPDVVRRTFGSRCRAKRESLVHYINRNELDMKLGNWIDAYLDKCTSPSAKTAPEHS